MKADNKFVLIIFGASGDLTIRKLIPAIFRLFKGKLLTKDQFVVLGVSRTELSDDQFRNLFRSQKKA